MQKISKDKYKKYLTLKGVSNKDLAEIAGISVVTLSRAINGKANTAPATFGKIATALGVTPTDILEEVKE